jgi:hypothetical protein
MKDQVIKVDLLKFSSHKKRCLDNGEKVIMKRRIFVMPAVSKAMIDSSADIRGEHLIRKPTLIARQPEPDADAVQGEAEKKDEEDS